MSMCFLAMSGLEIGGTLRASLVSLSTPYQFSSLVMCCRWAFVPFVAVLIVNSYIILAVGPHHHFLLSTRHP